MYHLQHPRDLTEKEAKERCELCEEFVKMRNSLPIAVLLVSGGAVNMRLGTALRGVGDAETTMKRWRRWTLSLISLSLLASLGVAVPNRWEALAGWWAGEAFLDGQPTRYWREALRRDGLAGELSGSTWLSVHQAGQARSPVLLACARDPDPLVRSTAIYVLGVTDTRGEAVRDLLRAGLHDPIPSVRGHALLALGHWGPMARPEVPRIVELLHDPNEIVVARAEVALWRLDPARARTEIGWREFSCEDEGFAVEFPGEPTSRPYRIPEGPGGLCFEVNRRAIVTAYQVVCLSTVFQAPDEQWGLLVLPDDARPLLVRLAPMRDRILAGFGCTLKSEAEVRCGSRPAVEWVLHKPSGGGMIRIRTCWTEDTAYLWCVISNRQTHNAPACDHFLNSFRILDTPAAPDLPE